uniref:Capsid protein n=1 Tax=Betatorquevirus 016G TaxID=3163411 RepID=A0AAU7STD1_9VIRU
MPWFYKRPYYRRRRLWRRRFRAPFRRRFWRKRYKRYRHRVRKHKLPFLRLKEWQPKRINRLKIIGTLPLYITTSERTANNLRLYEDEIAPHLVPSLGGFSITTFTLRALFQLFQKGRCWWTQSNNELPLIRYTGCTMKFYRAEASDTIILYHNCFPMIPTLDTYNSTQPTIMQLNKNHRILRCKKNNNLKKPYHKVKIKPPSQLTNRWFFQKELADVPLVMLMAAAMSVDRWYINSTSVSSTVGFTSINTDLFKYHNWATPTTYGYHPQDNMFLWTFQQTPTPPTTTQIKFKNLIFLGGTNNYSVGNTIHDTPLTHTDQGTQEDWQKKRDKYKTNSGYWGNIFMSPYINNPNYIILFSKWPISDLATYYKNSEDETIDDKLQQLTKPLTIACRYNPYPDTGIHNEIFLTSLTETKSNWTPTNPKLQRNNLPLWIGLWGYIDFQKITNVTLTIDTLMAVTIKSDFIHPKQTYYVPIDQDFLNGNSPYRPKQPPTASDKLNWHPKTTTQYQSITHICNSGPGTIKLPPNVSSEAHVVFKFYFKLGGCAAPIKTIEDPKDQTDFPLPDNILRSTSFQSPDIPYQNYLYSFDWRRDYLTKKATERIKKYSEPEKTVLESTGINLFNPLPAPNESSSETDSSQEEKEKETLLQLLHKHKLKQRKYRHRILQLMQSLE